MDKNLRKLERGVLAGENPAALFRARVREGVLAIFEEPNGFEVWVHLIVIADGKELKTILPNRNYGPYYNIRRHGRAVIPKGSRAYTSLKNVRKAISHSEWYKGEIVYESLNHLIWRYDVDRLPKGVEEMRASVFIRLHIDAVLRIADFL